MAIDLAAIDGLAPPGGFTVENIIECNVQSPPDGVYVRNEHEGDVTSLAVTDWLPDCVATASQDGRVLFLYFLSTSPTNLSLAQIWIVFLRVLTAHVLCVASLIQVRFWGSEKSAFNSLIPHEGQSVSTVAFLAALVHPNANVLLTAVRWIT